MYSEQWHTDETGIKIKRQQHWILLYYQTRIVIAFCLSSTRNSNTVLILFKKPRNATDTFSLTIVTD
ncbi:MAG TPA: DDE-type integrase/transposase/recombinase [Candidatus Coprocola pullicola]|nr:DDE-type integrase/transposase/recombinase [Candidatus Coprocola pullicola]